MNKILKYIFAEYNLVKIIGRYNFPKLIDVELNKARLLDELDELFSMTQREFNAYEEKYFRYHCSGLNVLKFKLSNKNLIYRTIKCQKGIDYKTDTYFYMDEKNNYCEQCYKILRMNKNGDVLLPFGCNKEVKQSKRSKYNNLKKYKLSTYLFDHIIMTLFFCVNENEKVNMKKVIKYINKYERKLGNHYLSI